MAFPGAPGAIWLGRGINMKNDPGDFAPIDILGSGIEQAQISDKVLLVIRGQSLAGRRVIGDGRIERRGLHGQIHLSCPIQR